MTCKPDESEARWSSMMTSAGRIADGLRVNGEIPTDFEIPKSVPKPKRELMWRLVWNIMAGENNRKLARICRKCGSECPTCSKRDAK